VKFLALALLVLLAPRADIRFEREGLRVGEALVQGEVLELKGAGAATFLASGSSVESLTAALEIELAAGRSLTLEPGLRVTREEGGYRFAAHGSRKIRFEAAGESVVAVAPVVVSTTAEGWRIGERSLAGGALRAGLQNQDDTKENLDRMLQAKERMKPGGVSKLSSRSSRMFRGDPLTGGQAVNSISVRTIPQVSPSGAP